MTNRLVLHLPMITRHVIIFDKLKETHPQTNIPKTVFSLSSCAPSLSLSLSHLFHLFSLFTNLMTLPLFHMCSLSLYKSGGLSKSIAIPNRLYSLLTEDV